MFNDTHLFPYSLRLSLCGKTPYAGLLFQKERPKSAVCLLSLSCDSPSLSLEPGTNTKSEPDFRK